MAPPRSSRESRNIEIGGRRLPRRVGTLGSLGSLRVVARQAEGFEVVEVEGQVGEVLALLDVVDLGGESRDPEPLALLAAWVEVELLGSNLPPGLPLVILPIL